MRKIVFATRNQNKIIEIQSLLDTNDAAHSVRIVSLDEIGFQGELPETSPTIEENAIQKATYLYNKYRLNCFAEDTGLVINALDGEPGVHSARYAGDHRNDQDNINLVIDKLAKKDDLSAHFKTVIALYLDGKLHLFTGIAEGCIVMKPRGTGGFGYDSIFQPKMKMTTFAEMDMDEKNKISHRKKALAKMLTFLQHLN